MHGSPYVSKDVPCQFHQNTKPSVTYTTAGNRAMHCLGYIRLRCPQAM